MLKAELDEKPPVQSSQVKITTLFLAFWWLKIQPKPKIYKYVMYNSLQKHTLYPIRRWTAVWDNFFRDRSAQ